MNRPGMLGDFKAVETRHMDVSDYEVEAIRIFDDLQRLAPVGCCEDFIAFADQKRSKCYPQVSIIFND